MSALEAFVSEQKKKSGGGMGMGSASFSSLGELRNKLSTSISGIPLLSRSGTAEDGESLTGSLGDGQLPSGRNSADRRAYEDIPPCELPSRRIAHRLREIARWDIGQLGAELQRIGIAFHGDVQRRRIRLRQHLRRQLTEARKREGKEGKKGATGDCFSHLVVMDLECTCEARGPDGKEKMYEHEIIELPAVVVDVEKMEIVGEWRTYVRPKINKQLTGFCSELTGIEQEDVDSAPYFKEAIGELTKWLDSLNMDCYLIVTDGSSDMWKFMQLQYKHYKMKMPHRFRAFCNLKRAFEAKTCVKLATFKPELKTNMQKYLAHYGIEPLGRAHSGLDDARNLARVCIEMLKEGHELREDQRVRRARRGDSRMENKMLEGAVNEGQREYWHWARRLEMKLKPVQREEFLSGEHLECDSCDERTKKK